VLWSGAAKSGRQRKIPNVYLNFKLSVLTSINIRLRDERDRLKKGQQGIRGLNFSLQR
jgi:hypothetical protein